MNAQDIKRLAYQFGADICGIASMDRFEGAPKQMDPRYIMPEAKSMIVMGFRVMRGSLRGIEEGTFFSNYSAMGYGALTYNFMPLTVMNMCRVIEDEGYEAIPMGHQSDWRAIDNVGYLRENYSRPVAPGKAAPDVMINLRIAGFLCGIGEIGYSKMLLTPEFGPRLRVGIIITELELEPDPIIEPGTLCNRCMACVRECPGGCIPADRTVKANVGGYDLEWADVDMEKCDWVFSGGAECQEGEYGDYFDKYDKKRAGKFELHQRLAARDRHAAARIAVKRLVLHHLAQSVLNRDRIARQLKRPRVADVGALAAGDASFAVKGVSRFRKRM